MARLTIEIDDAEVPRVLAAFAHKLQQDVITLDDLSVFIAGYISRQTQTIETTAAVDAATKQATSAIQAISVTAVMTADVAKG
jgi:adenosyl cobinamide kinase/adenosyl cobinamide phosphate guanylyltransferase